MNSLLFDVMKAEKSIDIRSFHVGVAGKDINLIFQFHLNSATFCWTEVCVSGMNQT